MYAWTVIQGGTDEKPVHINRGAKVTASDLGVSKDEFQAMVDSGAIREKPYPAPKDYKGSAIDYLREQLAEATGASDLEEATAQKEISALEDVSTGG